MRITEVAHKAVKSMISKRDGPKGGPACESFFASPAEKRDPIRTYSRRNYGAS